jgi:hypothetical protein
MPNKFTEKIKSQPLYTRIRSSEVDPENLSEFTGKIPELLDEELYPETDLLSEEELKILLRINKLKRLYLEQEEQEIIQLSNPSKTFKPDLYYSFVLELTKAMEELGEQMVCNNLEPLGFQSHHYTLARRIR